MYRAGNDRQVTFYDFNQSCGMQLDEENKRVLLADRMPWEEMGARIGWNLKMRNDCKTKWFKFSRLMSKHYIGTNCPQVEMKSSSGKRGGKCTKRARRRK